MDEQESQEQEECGCGCGCALSNDHLRGVIYVPVEGKQVLVNMTCYRVAYGDPDDIFLKQVKGESHA